MNVSLHIKTKEEEAGVKKTACETVYCWLSLQRQGFLFHKPSGYSPFHIISIIFLVIKLTLQGFK